MHRPGRRSLSVFLLSSFVGSMGLACTQQAPPAPTTAPAASPAATPAPPPTVAPAASPPVAASPAASPAAAASPRPAASPSPAASPRGAASGSGKAEVSALWFGRNERGVTGGTSTVRVSIEKGANKELRVGFFEEEVGGSGQQWRAAGWMAVVMSSFLLGLDPSEYRYTYEVGGRTDGPSAGALMTVATLATLLGHTVRDDAAMTGTINPDGTIGPVGGIPQKVDGAGDKKKKLVLIPAGQRNSIDMSNGQSVDVIERGRRLGVDVKEVSDIYEAYELLTGQKLPKPVDMKEVRPELPSGSFDRTKSEAKEWYSRWQELDSQYRALPSLVRQDFTDEMMDVASTKGKRADALYNQGLASPAYWAAFNATLNASIGYQTAKVIEVYLNNGEDGAINYLKSSRAVIGRIDALADRLQTQNAASIGDVVAISEAYGYLNMALGLANIADSVLERDASSEEEIIAVLAEATLWYTVASQLVELAKDSIDIGLGFGKAPVPAQDKVEALATLFRRAAETNLNYFESVVLNEIAADAGLHPDLVKNRFSTIDSNYTFAVSSLRAINVLKERAGGRPAGSYATLGGALNSYVLSSQLIAKYYSLDADVNADGQITGVKNERAMINMLDFAERRSKEIIGMSVAVDGSAVQPVLNYESAKVDREGNLDDKFNAFVGYWTASLQGQMIGILSGKAKVVQ